MKKQYLLFIISVFLISCTGTKKMTKKATTLEQSGMYQEASQYYLSALQRKSTNVDAAMGLKRTGQMVMDDYLADYFKVHNLNKAKDAVYTHKKASSWKASCAVYKVVLDIPDYYQDYYDADLALYLEGLYDQAISLLDKEDFDASALVFDEILSFDSNYKDVRELKSYARLEPVYRKGQAALDAKKFRKAYYLFQKTISYKDSEELQAHALKEAQYPLAMLPFENATTVSNAEKALESQFLHHFINNKNPFIKIIDRSHIETILQEQELGLSGLVDAQSAAQAGDLFGAKALLTGKLVALDIQGTRIKAERKKGWESYKQKKYNAQTKEYDTITKYKKVYYKEHYGFNSVNLTLEYKLISTETGEIIATNLFTDKRQDEVRYITYDGNKSKLYAGSWEQKDVNKSSDAIYDGYQDRKRITNLLKASKSMKSVEDLKTLALRKVSEKAVSEINSYNPENE